ncbi:unnamed protein product [Urochloa humidicola]
MATTYNFDLLDLADGESGDAAVSVVVSKKKTEAAAEPADAAEPTAQEKSKDFYYTKLQHDQGVRLCKQEHRRLKDVLTKLRAEAKKLKEQPGNNEARLEELLDEQRKLSQEKMKLSDQERELVLQKEAFYRAKGMTLSRDDCHDTKLKFDEGVRLYRQQHRKLSYALENMKGEKTKLKEQPGNNEARLEELLDERWKLTQEQSKLWHQERELLLQEEAFYRANEMATSFDYRYAMQQLDEGMRLCVQEVTMLREVLIKLRGVETKLREQPGNEARLEELSNEQRKLRQEQRKLREDEAKLLKQKKAMVREYEEEPNNNSNGGNEDPGSNYNGVNGSVYNNNDGGSCDYSDYAGNNDQYDGGDPHGHDDERQVGRGHDHFNNRQGYRQGQRRMIQVYRPKVKVSSDAGTEAEEKPEASVVSAIDAEQNADNADAVPASESDKSAAGGAAQDGPHNGQGAPTGTKNTFQRKGTVNGSEKRKKKNAKKNSGTEPDKVKKQDSEGDGSKKQADNQPQPEDTKTLAEYERMREEKRKSSEASKPEERKVTAEEFKGCQMLEKKKLDDVEALIKVEKAQPKVKESKKEEVQAEAAAKDSKPKKVTIPRQSLGFFAPRRVSYTLEDGSFSRVSFNGGGFQGGRRNSSTEPRVNGREPQKEAGVHNGNGAPQSAYNAQGDSATRGDYSSHREGNGGNDYGRGHSGYQGNGGYHHQQQQGGNVGRYQQERDGNGGNYQQRRYQQRRNFAPVPNFEDVYKFPALPVPASSARSVPASETATAPAKASAAAPAQA